MTLFSGLLCVCLCICQSCSNSNETGGVAPTATPIREVSDVGAMIKRLTTQDGCKDFTAEMRMTAVDQNRKHDRVEFKVQRKYSGDRAKTFFAVLSPREETDKAFLAVEQADQATEAFSYLAGLRKLSKMSSDRQLAFRGAKVTVQELLGMELDQYTHTPGERVNERNVELIKVEFKEKPDRYLAFPRIIGYFREKDRRPERFELYDTRDELQKRVVIEEVKQIENYQTITSVAIDDLLHKLKLKLETREIEYDRGLSDKIFTEDYLRSYISSATQRLDQSR
jgi:Outer membrane lipoprotein-sorting protein